jgi:hypothetical protein
MLREKLGELKNPFWLDDIASLRKTVDLGLSRGDFEGLKRELHAAVQKKQRGRTLNWIALGLVFDEQRTLDDVKRGGILRASKYNFNPVFPTAIVSSILLSADNLGLSKDTARYLHSVQYLLTLAPLVRAKQSKLAKQLSLDPHTSLKSLLVVLDLLFLRRDLGSGPDSFNGLEIEDLAEGFSYLLHLYTTIGRLSDDSLILVDVPGVRAGEYQAMLVQASLVRTYQQCEILIDTLGYGCSPSSSGNGFTVSPPEPTIEQSIRWGYIQHQQQTASNRAAAEMDVQARQVASQRFTARELYDVFGHEQITVAKDLVGARFVFSLPMVRGLADFLSSVDAYREEISLVADAEGDYFVPFANLASVKIAHSLTIGDIFRVHRWINIYRWYIVEHLLRNGGIDSDLSLRSLVPFFTKGGLMELFSVALEDKGKAEEALNCLSWNRDEKAMFDVQYQPILAGEHYYTLPMNIFGSSDAVRNALQLTRKRPGGNSPEDLIGKALAARFTEQGIWAQHSVKYKFNGANGEIDAMAIVGESLCIVECKNALLPANVHELRTTYEHIIHGREQLDTIAGIFQQPGFCEHLCHQLGWLGKIPTNLVTCLVLGNKMFSGYRIGGHPIRSFAEIAGFVWPGKFSFGDRILPLRPEGKLDENSLKNYLDGDSMHRNIFRCMREIRRDYDLGGNILSLDSYGLDMRALADALGIVRTVG